MVESLSVRASAHNATPCSVPAHELRIVSKSHATAPKLRLRPEWHRKPRTGTCVERLVRSIRVLEQRYAAGRGTNKRSRYATRPLARAAVNELIDVLALIGMHMPIRTKRDRAWQHELEPIFDAMLLFCRLREGGAS
jgi:hypothetical protein